MADKHEQTVTQSTSKSLKLERVPIASINGFIVNDVSTGRQCPLYVPNIRGAVLDCLHGLAHQVIRAALKMVSSRFMWPRMTVDIRNRGKGCVM